MILSATVSNFSAKYNVAVGRDLGFVDDRDLQSK